MKYPNDIRCRCGGQVWTRGHSRTFYAECSECGRKVGPSESIMSLYAEWYDMIPARNAFEDAVKTMGEVIMRLADAGTYVDAKDLIKLSSEEIIGRRVLNMLHDSGLIRGRYILEDEEITMEEAFEAKSQGKKIKVSFRKAFHRDPA